ncbi:uncharacterized protein IL334_000536 [Kwoniella shivajii]|uniref:RecA family profile 1 domain-containing protein n=1 Tax=Kwoniella shivajii TaxID=564305 RepID=A0ABZ1CPX4_9TREE|nr:hypothetical protein IL334_000536 [Kwoniella shivajii]
MSFIIPSIDQLDVSKELIEAVNRSSLSTSSILLTPLPRLAELLKVKISTAQSYVRQVSHAITPSTKRLNEVYDIESGPSRLPIDNQGGEDGNTDLGGKGKGKGRDDERRRGKWNSTGDDGFDKALGGGIRRGCLYEITGESAAGKSHLALHLALSFQLPSLSSSPGGSLILTSERELSTDRLVQLGKHLLSIHERDSLENGEIRVKNLLDNVLTNRVGDVDALEHALNYAVPAILESRLSTDTITNANPLKPRDESTNSRSGSIGSSSSSSSATSSNIRNTIGQGKTILPIRLIILDSITALFRGGSTTDEKPTAPSSISLTERSKRLCIVADALKSLAVKYDLAVIVINQVSDVFNKQPNSNPIMNLSQPTSSFTQTQPFTGIGMKRRSLSNGGAGEEGENDIPMLYKTQSRWFSGESDSLKKEASLGIVWANSVNVRIMLSRTGRRRLINQIDLKHKKRRTILQKQEEEEERQLAIDNSLADVDVEENIKATLIRKLHVVFSPFSPSSTIDYVITSNGVHSLADSHKAIDMTEVVKKKREKERIRKQNEDEDEAEGEYNGNGVGGFGNRSGTRDDEEDDGDGNQGKEDWDEVFDDFGELPDEFWNGTYGLDGQIEGGNGSEPGNDTRSDRFSNNRLDYTSINGSNRISTNGLEQVSEPGVKSLETGSAAD